MQISFTRDGMDTALFKQKSRKELWEKKRLRHGGQPFPAGIARANSEGRKLLSPVSLGDCNIIPNFFFSVDVLEIRELSACWVCVCVCVWQEERGG